MFNKTKIDEFMQDQTKGFIITKLKDRFPPTYLVIMITTVAYFISVLIGYTALSTFLAFPAVYIAPGLMLTLLLSKQQEQNFRKLIVAAFFLSTVIAVALVSILILFGVAISPYSISVAYVLLTFVSVALAVILGKSPRINASRVDYAFLAFSLIAYASLLYLFTSVPRLFTMDETTYIALSRYATLRGEIYPMGLSPGKFDLTSLVDSRFFWTLHITSFLGSTGLAAYQTCTINTMFLPMIAITSTLLIPNKFKDNKLLQVAIFTLVLTNPLLLLFSDFVLSDLSMTFYLLLAFLFFIKSFNQSEKDKVLISLQGLLFSFLALLIAFLVKENITIVLAMYIILIFYILRYRLYKVNKVWKALSYALTLPLIAYEILIDIPYVISVWFIRNEAVSLLTRQFLIVSPAEWVLGLFMPTPWNPTTIFSQDPCSYLQYLYRMLSPETLGLLIAGIGLTLPLLLVLKRVRRDVQMRISIYVATMTLWLSYFLYLSTNALEDIARYFLFMVPIFIAISLVALYEVFSNRSITFGIALTLPMLLLLWIQSTLSIEKGGIYFSYGVPKLNWTNGILVIQLMLYISLITVNLLKKTSKISWKKMPCTPLNVQKITFISLVIAIFVSSTYFSAYSLSTSNYFKENDAETTSSMFNDIDLNNTFVVSNFHTYMQPYAPNYLLADGYLFPPPMTEKEFTDFLQMAPNNTLLIISQDPAIAWYEYANSYIGNYIKTDIIPLQPKTQRVTYDGLLLDTRLGSAVNGVVYDESENEHTALMNGGNITVGFFDKAVEFNGENEYASVSNFDFPDTYSVEIWFMLKKEPSDFGLMDDGTPISKMLLAKRYGSYVELMLLITSEGEIQAIAKNENNDVRFNCNSPKEVVQADNWYQIILSVNGQDAKLYVNGKLVGGNEVKGLNQRLKDHPESLEEPLKIGADGTSAFTKYRYFLGCIEDVRIYNRSLTSEEIGNMYYNVKLLNLIDEIKVFKTESPIQLHMNSSGDLVNITCAEVYFTNATNVRLTVKADAIGNQKIFVAVGTLRFLKVLTANLENGQNEISWDFEHRLEDRSPYGLYVASMAKIVIYDEGGNLLYDKTHNAFTLSGGYLALWVSALSLFAFFVLFLNRNFHFG
jgi:hypothetical protein